MNNEEQTVRISNSPKKFRKMMSMFIQMYKNVHVFQPLKMSMFIQNVQECTCIPAPQV